MDMSNFRPDQIHVAQQTRRDKLRFHHGSNNMEVYANNMNQTLPSHDGLNHENATFRNCRPEGSSNICYDPSQFCSEIPNNFNPSPTVIIRDDPQQYFNTWKSIGSQSTTDWVANQGPNFVGEGPSLKIINSSNIPIPLIDNHQSSEISDMHCSSNSSIYHNALQELVTSSSNVRSFSQHPSNLISELDYPTAKDNSNTQALSLSLSSLPSPKVHEYNLGNARQDVMGTQGLIHRNPGPLGPFTGYATILRSSKFLRPAQVLLDELCCGARSKNVEICRLSDKILEDVRVSGDSSGLLFGFNGLNDRSGANGGTGGWVDSYHQPVENLQKKAKLLYMQDEVCKRYKQYHQQMQMVVSSFESVAGLSAATPYVSLALKTVSKHFRCLKNAITDQLKSIRNVLGDELLSANSAGTSSNKGDANVSMLKFFDQSFHKQKGAASLGINLESQHVWRPQRGLPERAVSILRAWLFDHFLHPYPTDTDKHMLATQTGLTRNQVSNWFINARVRVWKPMVEEIHMLETKGVAAADQTRILDPPITANCDDDKSNNITQSLNNRLRMITATPENQVECSNASPSQPEPDRFNPNAWNHEKRSRIEYHVPSSVIDGSLMGFVPRPSHEMAGLGAVSLTLGLRQSAENGQRTAFQPQEHHRRLRPHFGGQMIRDFVG